MKTTSIIFATLAGSAAAGDFTWQAHDGLCSSQTAFTHPVVSHGKHLPSYKTEKGINYCEFDGHSDYLAINNKYFKGETEEFSVQIEFRTSYNKGNKWANWAFLDCDRSDHFNVYITPAGRLGFSTAGKKQNNHGAGIHDMESDKSAGTFNDGKWHTATVTYNKGVKTMYVDDVQVGSANDNGRKAIGKGTKQRFCFIGDGSESQSFNKARNGKYYDGDIATIQYKEEVTTDFAISNTNCNLAECSDWTCEQWCDCFEPIKEEDGTYDTNSCGEVQGETESCNCELYQ